MSTPDITATPVGHSGTAVDITERKSWSGGGGLATIIILISIILIAPAIFLIGTTSTKLDAGTISVPLGVALILAGACCFLLSLLGLTSVRIISPGETRVIQFFGRYIGTIRHTGLRAIPPLSNPTKVSIKVRNFETNTIKVNDLNGNPINIGAIVVWQVADTTTIPSLSGSTDIVSAELAEEVAARATIAGLEIIETRISSLAYAPEIAQSMLQRQQAAAIVDARETIVDGAVSMVETALSQLDERDIVDLDPERRATMVSNLLVVLCSDNNAQPVINTGSLYT